MCAAVGGVCDMRENRDILANSLPVFLIKIALDGCIMMVNDPMREALEKSHDEIIGKSLTNTFVTENSRAVVVDLMRQALETGRFTSGIIRLKTEAGATVPMEWQIQPVFRKNGKLDFFWCFGLDLTSLREMERKLSECEQRYHSVFYNNDIPMLLIDQKNTDIAKANSAACRFYGYTMETLTSMKYSSINISHTGHARKDIMHLLSGKKGHIHSRHRMSDGTAREVEIYSGQMTIARKAFVYAMIHDVTESKRMEEELNREREEQLLIFNSVPAMIFYKNKRNRFIRVNKTWSNFLGLPQKSIEGYTVEEILPDIAEKDWREDLEVISTGCPKRNLLDIITTKNGPRWIRTDKIPFRDEKGDIIGILGFSIDITEPKRAGDAIQALMVSSGSETGVNLFDRIVMRIRQWLGVDCSMIISLTGGVMAEVLSIHTEGEDVSPFCFPLPGTIFERIFREGYVCYSEGANAFFSETGVVFRMPVEGFAGVSIRNRIGEPIGCICIISRKRLLLAKSAKEVMHIFAAKASLEMERIRSEAALRESEEKYRTLVETSPDAIAMIDLKGYIVTANYRFAELLGIVNMEDVFSPRKMVFEYIVEDDRTQAARDSEMLLNGQCAVINRECSFLRRDGAVFPAEISMSLVRDDHGEPSAFIGIFRNITERKKAEQRHAEAVKMAERSSRLASVGTLAAGISHEINQPLTALKVKVDSMLYWKEMNIAVAPDDLDNDLRFISQQIERIDDIVKHMRVLARKEIGREPDDIDLNGVIRHVTPLIRQQISAHGIKLNQALDNDLPPIRGYRTLLQQVVVNLLVNAVHALDESRRAEKTIRISTSRHLDFCHLEVSDNGVGIPDECLNQVFDPFFSTKIGSEGMGLGLSICHNIITEMGGTIIVENNPEGGARFLVAIPLFQSDGRGL